MSTVSFEILSYGIVLFTRTVAQNNTLGVVRVMTLQHKHSLQLFFSSQPDKQSSSPSQIHDVRIHDELPRSGHITSPGAQVPV